MADDESVDAYEFARDCLMAAAGPYDPHCKNLLSKAAELIERQVRARTKLAAAVKWAEHERDVARRSHKRTLDSLQAVYAERDALSQEVRRLRGALDSFGRALRAITSGQTENGDYVDSLDDAQKIANAALVMNHEANALRRVGRRPG